VLVSTASGYALRLPQSQVDVYVFERLVRLGRTDDALSLWRGTPLDGIPGRFAAAERARLTERRLSVLEQRIADGLTRDEDWASELTRLVVDHPYRERLRALLMTALHRSGLWAEALAAYQDAERVLADDLGVCPGPELRRAYEHTLAAPDLAWHYLDRVEDADLLLRPGRGPCERFAGYREAMAWLEERWRAVVEAGVISEDPTLAGALATSLRAFMHRRGYWAHQRRLAAAAAAQDDDRAVAQGQLEMGSISYLRGRLVQADAEVSHAVTLFGLLGDVPGIARATNNLSLIRAEQGRLGSAAVLAGEYLRLCAGPADRSVALDNLALVALRRGRHAEAVSLCFESMEAQRSIGSSVLASTALHLQGQAYLGLGDHKRGVSCLRRSVRLSRLTGNRHREQLAAASLAGTN
jgi:tetratricopeptide (TPR) repeat protein